MKLLIVCKKDIYSEVVILADKKKLLVCLDDDMYALIKKRASELHISASSYLRLCVIKETQSKKGGKIL